MHYEVKVTQEQGLFVIRPEVNLDEADLARCAAIGSPTVYMGGRVFMVTSLADRPPFIRVGTEGAAQAQAEALRAQLEAAHAAFLDSHDTPIVRTARRVAIQPPGPLCAVLQRATRTALEQVLASLDLGPVQEVDEDATFEVGAVIALEGAFEGAVGVAASFEDARRLHAALTEEDLPEGNPEHGATLCELANMVAGVTGGLAQMRNVRLQLPTVALLDAQLLGIEPLSTVLSTSFGHLALSSVARKPVAQRATTSGAGLRRTG